MEFSIFHLHFEPWNLLLLIFFFSGCELLKNLVLTGFNNITVIDLDTIDVSNLNRQFLFQKKHVGKSKALVAKESALQFKPDVNITALHFSAAFGDLFEIISKNGKK